MTGHRPPSPAKPPMSSWPPPAPFPAEYRRGGPTPTRRLPAPEQLERPPAPGWPAAGAPAPRHPAPRPHAPRHQAPGPYPPPGAFPAPGAFPPPGQHPAAGSYPPPGNFPPHGPRPPAAPWAAGHGSYPPAARRSGRRGRLPLLTIVLLLIGALAAAAWVGLVPGVQLRGSTAPGSGNPAAAGPGAGDALAAPGAGRSEFCRLAQQQADEVTNAQDGGGDIVGMVQRVRERSSRMVEVAPPEIRRDVETVHQASEAFFNGRPGADTFTRLQSPELRSAGLRVAEYLQSSCGVEMPTGLPTGG